MSDLAHLFEQPRRQDEFSDLEAMQAGVQALGAMLGVMVSEESRRQRDLLRMVGAEVISRVDSVLEEKMARLRAPKAA